MVWNIPHFIIILMNNEHLWILTMLERLDVFPNEYKNIKIKMFPGIKKYNNTSYIEINS